MRTWAAIFSIYFLVLCGAPCGIFHPSAEKQDVCCENDALPVNDQDHGDAAKDCAGCNPLSACHCCGSFVAGSPDFSITSLPSENIPGSSYTRVFVSSFTAPVWQPPRIS